MNWFWLNIPLAAVFFAAWVGVPLWLVIKRPDEEPARQTAQAPAPGGPATAAEPQTACIPQRDEHLAGV
jgi:hypothetical protein